jgi:hypothetical protein
VSGGVQDANAIEGAAVLVLVNVRAALSAGAIRLSLSAREGPASGTWHYTLSDTRENRIQYGRITGNPRHMDVLRHAAGMCTGAYPPGTTEHRLLQHFAHPDQDQQP